MAVLFDTEVAGADANSYSSLVEMDQFVENHLPCSAVTEWQAMTDADKQRYLIRACCQIDAAYRYHGRRLTDLTGDTAQALEFPRFSLITKNGKTNIEAYRSFGVYSIDPRVKKAQQHQALFLIQRVLVEGDSDPVGGSTRSKLQAEGVKSISIGDTSETYTGKSDALCGSARALLKPLIRKTHRL